MNTDTCIFIVVFSQSTCQWYSNHRTRAHGPHRSPEKPVQINKHIWLYHNIDQEKKIPIISFVRIEWFFIWTNLFPLHPRMLGAKFGWNWLSGSGEEDFKKNFNIILHFHYYLPLKKGGALHLNKFESPPPKNALCQVWLKELGPQTANMALSIC